MRNSEMDSSLQIINDLYIITNMLPAPTTPIIGRILGIYPGAN